MDTDDKGPREFLKFAAKLPDDLDLVSIVLGLVSIVIGTVFGALWFLGTVFKKASTSAAHKEP